MYNTYIIQLYNLIISLIVSHIILYTPNWYIYIYNTRWPGTGFARVIA